MRTLQVKILGIKRNYLNDQYYIDSDELQDKINAFIKDKSAFDIKKIDITMCESSDVYPSLIATIQYYLPLKDTK